MFLQGSGNYVAYTPKSSSLSARTPATHRLTFLSALPIITASQHLATRQRAGALGQIEHPSVRMPALPDGQPSAGFDAHGSRHFKHRVAAGTATCTTRRSGTQTGRHRAKGTTVVEHGAPRPPLVLPLSVIDVDAELWQVLDMCTNEELEAVYSVLHAPSPFSPVIKSLVAEKEPPLVEQRGRLSLMHKIESRFRFLAADQSNLLKGTRPSYRDTLLAIRDRIDVPCSLNLSTFDLETELFLHVLNNCLEYVQEGQMEDVQEAAARATMQEGDGMSSSANVMPRRANWVERVTAPIMFGVKELVPTLAKLGSAITVTAVGRSTASQLAQQLVASHLRYQAAARVMAAAAQRGVASGSAALAGWGRQAMLESAAKGLQSATARYSALQGALSFIGPIMWGWLAVDLAFKAIGTDYARIIRAVFILAQVRLLRTNGFSNPQDGTPSQSTNSTASSSNNNTASRPSAAASAVTAAGPVVLASHHDAADSGASAKDGHAVGDDGSDGGVPMSLQRGGRHHEDDEGDDQQQHHQSHPSQASGTVTPPHPDDLDDEDLWWQHM